MRFTLMMVLLLTGCPDGGYYYQKYTTTTPQGKTNVHNEGVLGAVDTSQVTVDTTDAYAACKKELKEMDCPFTWAAKQACEARSQSAIGMAGIASVGPWMGGIPYYAGGMYTMGGSLGYGWGGGKCPGDEPVAMQSIPDSKPPDEDLKKKIDSLDRGVTEVMKGQNQLAENIDGLTKKIEKPADDKSVKGGSK